MNRAVERAFNQVKFECRPDKDIPFGIYVFDLFFGGLDKGHNFIGGMNDRRNTMHENMFHAMHPNMKKQVHFGTGKGGYEKYLAKRYTADFYDEENNVIYEIDGNSHKTELQSLKDKIRDYFFWHELGIKTIRFTNQEVENMVVETLEYLHEKGVLHV